LSRLGIGGRRISVGRSLGSRSVFNRLAGTLGSCRLGRCIVGSIFVLGSSDSGNRRRSIWRSLLLSRLSVGRLSGRRIEISRDDLGFIDSRRRQIVVSPWLTTKV
jgi:hypothetical protein